VVPPVVVPVHVDPDPPVHLSPVPRALHLESNEQLQALLEGAELAHSFRVVDAGPDVLLPHELVAVLPDLRVEPAELAAVVGEEIVILALDQLPHADPDFITFTYGEQSNILRGRKLLSLVRGDYVFFFESFVRAKPEELEGRTFKEIKASQAGKDKVYCIIGYFQLDSIHGYRDIIGDPAVRERVRMNAHMKRDPLDQTILIAMGSENSKMMERARSLSTIGYKKNGAKNYVYSEEFSKISGLTRQVYRAVKTIEESSRIENVLDWLSV